MKLRIEDWIMNALGIAAALAGCAALWRVCVLLFARWG